MKYEIVREIVRPQAKVIQFPRNRIVRIINTKGEPVCEDTRDFKKGA
jgi:hypothetical protein